MRYSTRIRVTLLSLVAALAGCFGSERRDQYQAVERARASVGPSYAVDEPAERIARGPAGDGGPASAGTEEIEGTLAQNPSLAVVREAAMRRNPDLKAALERWVAFLERAPQRTALPFPTVRYGYSSMFKMHTVEGMQEVPFPTKLLAEGRAALAEARAMRAEYDERGNVLREQADAAYAGLWLARREVGIVEENVALLDRFVDIARTKYEAGTATQPDLLRAEVERDTLRAEVAVRRRAVAVAASALNVLLDRAPEAPLGALGGLPAPVTPSAGAAPLERALARRHELAAASERTAAADAMLSRARQEWVPDLTLGGAYVRDFGMRKNEVELTGGITVPIWWGRINAGIAEAEADARRARAELRATRNRVLDEVKAATEQSAAAAESWRILATDALPRAEQNVKSSEAAYVAGQIDFLALVDAQRMLLMRRLEVERALAEYTVRRAELRRAIGEGGEAP